MIEALIAALRAERIEFTGEEIADICWLYATMPGRAPAPPAEEKKPEPKETGDKSVVPPREDQAASAPPPKKEDAPPETLQAPAPQQAVSGPSSPNDARGELLPAPGSVADGRARGVPFRVPGAVALPGALELTRALRPLMKRVASRTQRRLDEHATVDRIAEQRIWMPVMRATPGRWLEIALVVEDTFEMRPWGRTVREFQRLLGHAGAFRDVRPWRLALAEGGGFRLTSGAGSAARKPGELLDAAGARVILIVSDCSSPLWRDQAFMQTLKDWGARQPVAVVQVLPQRLWTSTVLRDARAVRVRSPRPGVPNAKLVVTEGAVSRRSARAVSGTSVPIVTLEKPSVIAWAGTVAGLPGASAHARVFPAFTFTDPPHRTVDQAWERFLGNASPVARDLARLLAAAPLTLPIMRLVQRTMLPESKQVHLAEIFRSELIFPVENSSDPESVRYEFKPEIRGRLLDDARASESVGVLRAALSEFIDARTGQPLDFLAMLRDPDAAGELPLNNETKPFANVAAQVLSRMGGRYQALAERLAKGQTPKAGPLRPPIAKADQIFQGHSGPVAVLTFSPDGARLASASSDRTVQLWDVRTGTRSHTFHEESETISAAFSPDSLKYATADTTGSVFIRDLTSPGPVARTPLGMLATSIAFSWDGQTLVGSTMYEVVVWDVSLREVRRFPHTGHPFAVCSPAGYAVAESDGANIWIRDVQTGTEVSFRGRGTSLYRSQSGPISALGYSPSGRFLAAAVPGAIVLWDAENGQELSRYESDAGPLSHLSLNTDARLVASVDLSGALRLWYTDSGRVRTLAASGIRSIAFSLTENTLAAGAEDGSILVWNLAAAAAPEKPVLTGKAVTPRRLQIVNRPTPAERALTEALTEALANAGHTLLPVSTTTPEAVVVIGRDAELARVVKDIAAHEGVEAIPLSVAGFAPGAIEFHDPSRWQTGFSQLLLRLDNLQFPGQLVNVPELPAIYARRRDVFQRLVELVRSDYRVAIIRGNPGSGKTTLAIDLARDPAIRRAFPGGIYWQPDSPPSGDARSLVIGPRFELQPASGGHTWFLSIDHNPIRSYAASTLPVPFITLPPLTPAEQDEIAAPCRIPERLRTPALIRMALLARWKRILLEFGEDPVSAWLADKPVPAEYGDVAEQFAIHCVLDLLPLPVRYALERLAPPQPFNPMMGGPPFIADSAPLREAERYARNLDLLDPRNGFLRVIVRDALLAGIGHPSAPQVADYYIHLKEAAGDAGWSGVPDDGFFLDHIASALSNAGKTGHLHDLLTDANWIARRLAGSGVEALLAEAGLAGLGEAFEKIFRGSDAPSTAEEIRKRLTEILQRLDNLPLPGQLIDVPELPAIYVRRRETYQVLVDWRRTDHPIAAILGAPGSGKQTLAIDFARDPAIRRAFPGGIYWAPDSPPPASARTLVIDPRYELESADRANTWFLTIDRQGLRSYVGQLTVTIIRIQPLTPAEQDEIAAPCRIPERLRTPALSRMALLARWKRILLEFKEEPVVEWLAARPMPAEYGDAAEQVAIQCALDLLPLPVRLTLERITTVQFMREQGAVLGIPALIASEVHQTEAARFARDLDLLDPDGQPRAAVRAALLSGARTPARQVSDYYIAIKEAAGDAGWSAVPDDGYFLDHIAEALATAGRMGRLRDLVTDPYWIERRLAAHGADALIADATLAGFGDIFAGIFRAPDAPSTPSDIQTRLAPLLPFEKRPRPRPHYEFFVSYSPRDTAGAQFVRDVAHWGGRLREYFMLPPTSPLERAEKRSAAALRVAPALLVLLSPNYLSSATAAQELRIFLDRQQRFRTTGFVIPVIFKPCEIPESLRDIQAIEVPGGFRRGAAYDRCLQAVAEALNRVASRSPKLPPLPDPDAERLASIAESRGYTELLRELYGRPDLSELYWNLLTSLRSDNETWEEWIERQSNQSV